MPQIDANDTTLNYETDGNGPVVMLSHSLASDLTIWNEQVGPLVDAGYCVLRYDTRGHGKSAVPAGPYATETLADDAASLLDALSIGTTHFCGVSQGGMIGQMLATRYPGRVASLMLCDTVAQMGTIEFWDARISMVRAGGMQAVADETIQRWFTASGRDRLQDEVERIRNLIMNTSVEGYCASCAAIRDMDQRDTIGSIAAPTMIILGEHDAGTPIEAAEAMRDLIADSVLHVIHDAAHLAHIEQAETFNQLLLGFLDSVSHRKEG